MVETLFDRCAQVGFVAAILLQVGRLAEVGTWWIERCALVAVIGSVPYVLYRVWCSNRPLEIVLPCVAVVVGLSALLTL